MKKFQILDIISGYKFGAKCIDKRQIVMEQKKSVKNFFKKGQNRQKDFNEGSSVLMKVASFLGLNNDYFVIMSRWEQEVGNKKVVLNGCKDGIVFTVTSSAVYLNDFNLRKRQIINRLNQYLGSKKIKDIKCEIK